MNTASALGKVASVHVVQHPLTDLLPHPKNPRIHPLEGSPAYENMVRSLEHDYFDPIVWNKRNGMLVSGHFRAKLLEKLGYTHADVVEVDYPEEVHLARMLAANKPVGEDSDEMLREIMATFADMDVDVDLGGLALLDNLDLLELGKGMEEPDFSFTEPAPQPSAVAPQLPPVGASAPPPTAAPAETNAFSGGPVGAETPRPSEGSAQAVAPPPVAAAPALANSGIKYVQLVYAQSVYDEVEAALNTARRKFAGELEQEFGEDGQKLTHVVLFALRKLSEL